MSNIIYFHFDGNLIAGDSFTATFVAQLLLGKTIREAHEKAVAVSAYVCTQRGAMPLLPAELKA